MNISTGWLSGITVNGIPVQTTYPCNTSNYTQLSSRDVKYIVMHYTGNVKDNAINNVKYYGNTPNVQASAHLFVDDTSIYQSVQLKDKAWHCGTKGTYYHDECRNTNSIGIEMCCTAGNYTPSEITIKNSAYLCAYLCQMIGITAATVDQYVVRHYDVTHKECPRLMVREPDTWVAFKQKVKDILSGKDDGDAKMTYDAWKDYMDRYLKELAEEPATWEKTAMDWGVKQRLIKGDEQGHLMPKKFMTRGEAMTILARQAGEKI